MEPITDLICIVLEGAWGIICAILAIILGIINVYGAAFIVGLIWIWPIFICSGIALIIHNLISALLFPLYAMFPFLYIMPNMCLSFLNNSAIAGLIPIGAAAIIGGILAIIVAIPHIIYYFVLILGCNSNGIALLSKISQTILSWICA